jgi:hypothetical protein
MQTAVKLIVETHTKNSIFIATKDSDIPSKVIDKCPKQIASDILCDITSYKIDPDENSWLILELVDTFYEEKNETAYIVFVCRVPGFPDKLQINDSYKWTEYSDVREKLDKLKGLL